MMNDDDDIIFKNQFLLQMFELREKLLPYNTNAYCYILLLEHNSTYML